MEDNVNTISYDNDSEPVGTTNDNLRILYITFAIIIGLLLIWIIVIVFTQEDPIKILGEMNNLSSQTPAVTDSNIAPIISDETLIIPAGYVNNITETNDTFYSQ